MRIIPEATPTPEPTMVPAPPSPPAPLRNRMEESMVKSGVLMLTDKFDQKTIMPLVQQIMMLNMLPEAEQPEEIKLYINSPGGSVFSAWHLIDTMKQSRIPVSTIAMGLAASCGVLTLMAGAKGRRFVTQNTSVMSHTYSWGSMGKEGELYAKVKEYEMASERMLAHYKKCTGKNEKYIRKYLLHPHDEWMSPEEVVKHGIADEIIETY